MLSSYAIMKIKQKKEILAEYSDVYCTPIKIFMEHFI